LLDALIVMRDWRFEYRSHFVWKKTYPGDRAGPDDWSSSVHELLLVGTRGMISAPASRPQYSSVFSAPVYMHSIKPDHQYKLIETYFPDLPKIEINPRCVRDGWDYWDGAGSLSGPPASGPAQAQSPEAVATPTVHPLDVPPRRVGNTVRP
jgi:N6-adenosine-specific RNA methylase IME4